MYDDTEEEWVDDEFVNDCLVLADGNNDGVLQIEGTYEISITAFLPTILL